MSELVTKLSEGDHPVEISITPDRTPASFKECLENGYVHVRFPNTRGGTTLGVAVDRSDVDLTAADFAAGTGHVVLSGSLTLDYVPVTCEARIDLPHLTGTGRLRVRT